MKNKYTLRITNENSGVVVQEFEGASDLEVLRKLGLDVRGSDYAFEVVKEHVLSLFRQVSEQPNEAEMVVGGHIWALEYEAIPENKAYIAYYNVYMQTACSYNVYTDCPDQRRDACYQVLADIRNEANLLDPAAQKLRSLSSLYAWIGDGCQEPFPQDPRLSIKYYVQ